VTFARVRRWWRQPGPAILGLAHLIVAYILVLRWIGALEPLELLVYDQYLKLDVALSAAPPEFVVVGLRESDELYFDEAGFNPAYSDAAPPPPLPVRDHILAQVLETVIAHQPAVIGLDLIRDRPEPPGYQRLEEVLRGHPEIVGVQGFRDEAEAGFAPPPAIADPNRVGFADLTPDGDGVVRRGLLFVGDGQTVHWSLAMRLAERYLRASLDDADYAAAWETLGRSITPQLGPNDGGYADAGAGGYHVLLTYPACTPPLPMLSFAEVLGGAAGDIGLEGKVVLVGNLHKLAKDFFETPLPCQTPGERLIAGPALHGQITSQLIRQALGSARPLRTTGQLLQDPQLGRIADSAWIWLWALLGGLAVLRLRGRAVLFAASGFGLALSAISIAAFVLLRWWIPIVPTSMATFATLLAAFAYSLVWEKSERGALMRLFSVYVSEGVADALWNQRDSFTEDGRPRPQNLTASVLFSDVADFTTVSERMDPQTLMAWLNEYTDAMVQIIVAHGGIIDKFSGDGVMAVFGIPIPRTTDDEVAEDARNAVDSAVAMRGALEALNRDWQTRGLPTAKIRVGIHTGELVAGSLGGATRMQYTVIGDTANTASRLESCGKGDPRFGDPDDLCRILISEACRRHIGDRYLAERIGPIQVKGRQEEVVVYRIDSGHTSMSPAVDNEMEGRSRSMAQGSDLRRKMAGGIALLLALVVIDRPGSAADQDEPPRLPVFVPSDIGAPSTRIVGGVRGIRKNVLPMVLAAKRTGLTRDPQPTLYWFVRGAGRGVAPAVDRGRPVGRDRSASARGRSGTHCRGGYPPDRSGRVRHDP